MIRHRIINGAAMIGALIGALYLPAMAVFAVIPVLATLMCVEFFRLLRGAGMPCYPRWGTVSVVVLIVGTGLCAAYTDMAQALRLESLLLAAIVFGVLLRACFARD